MNQALINELRAAEVQVRRQLHVLMDPYEDEGGVPESRSLELSNLLLARSNLLNGIAILVAQKVRR